jgi:hypothetical protein
MSTVADLTRQESSRRLGKTLEIVDLAARAYMADRLGYDVHGFDGEGGLDVGDAPVPEEDALVLELAGLFAVMDVRPEDEPGGEQYQERLLEYEGSELSDVVTRRTRQMVRLRIYKIAEIARCLQQTGLLRL